MRGSTDSWEQRSPLASSAEHQQLLGRDAHLSQVSEEGL